MQPVKLRPFAAKEAAMNRPGPACSASWVTLTLLPALLLPLPAPAADAVSREIAEKVCAAAECPPCVVRIQVLTTDAKTSSGTGILLRNGRILTAAHVLRGASAKNRPEVWFGGRGGRPLVNGAEGRAVTWVFHPSADLAAIDGVSAPPWARGAALAPSAPKEGETLTVVGLENTGAVRIYAGALLGPGTDSPLLPLGITPQHGDSGGPSFNASGEVAGILSGSGALTRITTTALETSGDESGRVTEIRKIPAAFAVNLNRVDWKAMPVPRETLAGAGATSAAR
jgi:S1-C subfamily serine protease